MYQDFAEIYDRLMDNVKYDSWADYYVPLQRAGFQMTGVDQSREMLWQAAQKARKQGMAIPFVQQDMKALNLHRPMDAVIATCDGINYLLTDEELKSFLRAAWRAIRPGGALIFDVSTPYKLREQLCSGLICEDLEDITYFWQNRWNARTRTVEMTLCFFVKEADGRYRRMEEEQIQKAWEAQELKNMLLSMGFRGVCLYGDGNLNPAKETDLRWHICATRPGEE